MSSPPPDFDDVALRLAAAGCVAAEDEAAELVGAAPDRATLDAWVARRSAGEPLAWVTGSVTFCGRRVAVAPGVYVPRRQTEELARLATGVLRRRGLAVDLCAGAGAVAAHLAAERPEAKVVAVERDERAAAWARRNGVSVVVGDLDAPLRPGPRFDVVAAVAPYVPTAELRFLPADARREPVEALDGGADGLDVVRRVVAAARRILRPGGWLLVEVGGDQDEALGPELVASGFDRVVPWHDDQGDLRGVASRAALRP